MNKFIEHILRWIKDPYYHFGKLWYRIHPNSMPDKYFISIVWKSTFGYKLNWEAPKTFNEKLQWLKLYDRNPIYTTFVDKYAVKKYIADNIGSQYIIPTLAVYESVDDIDISKLPNKFVLKCTHDSGSVILCKDKTTFDLTAAKIQLSKALAKNYYLVAREWPYKHVPRRIIAEEYLDSINDDLYDYKFFCFNGQVHYYKIDFNRQISHHANYFDINGTLQNFGELECPNQPNKNIIIPDNIQIMIQLAQKISQKIPFIRIDFYNVNGKIKFGEMTLYPTAGFGSFSDDSTGMKFGNLLHLPLIN